MRRGFPEFVVLLLVGVFALSFLGLLGWLVYFVSRSPGVVLDQFGEVGALLTTAGLSGAASLSSGLLAFHYRREEYGAGEETIFRAFTIVFTGILLCSGVWALAIAVFS